jgi:hypothetical protein
MLVALVAVKVEAAPEMLELALPVFVVVVVAAMVGMLVAYKALVAAAVKAKLASNT